MFIVGKFAEEEENGEAGTEIVLFDTDTNGPVVDNPPLVMHSRHRLAEVMGFHFLQDVLKFSAWTIIGQEGDEVRISVEIVHFTLENRDYFILVPHVDAFELGICVSEAVSRNDGRRWPITGWVRVCGATNLKSLAEWRKL